MTTSHALRPVDRRSPLPLWAQVEADLTRRLAAGEFGAGFPVEAELQQAYDVSRHTIREALRRLRDTGTLKSVRGQGTRVAEIAVEQPMGTLYSLFRSVEDGGMVQRSVVLELGTTTDADAAAALGLPAGDELVVIERLRHADDEPLAHDRVHLPANLAAPLLEADFTRAALHDELLARCGVRLTGGQERIAATMASAGMRAQLRAGAGPLLRVDRTGMVGRRVVETRVTHLRSDRFALVARWERARG